jgi:hypothetical protein
VRQVGPGPDHWNVFKVLWIADPAYHAAALVTGTRIDQRGAMAFMRAVPGAVLTRLRLTGSRDTGPQGWRAWPSEVLVRGDGCYAFRVQYAHFRRELVFRVAA